jgi:hypothetical protein
MEPAVRLVDRIIQAVLQELIRSERLVLVEGADGDALLEEVLRRFKTAPASAQLAPYLAKVLVQSTLVDELFADNDEIVALFTQQPG